MRIRNRLFPYPVLNNNSNFSDYTNQTTFELSFDNTEDVHIDDYLVFKNMCLKTNDAFLRILLKEGKVKGILIVECSSTVYREKYEISAEPKDIKIPINHFNGSIEISAFIYASEDIDEYTNRNFAKDYDKYRFKIEKYCILAADDGFVVNINNQPKTENKKSSIFTIIPDLESEDDLIHYSMSSGERKITLILPEKYFKYYNTIKQNDIFLNASFAILAIPVLQECLINIQKEMLEEEKTIEDICFDYPWFRSVRNAYKREKSTELTDDLFKYDTIPMELAQIVFNNTSCKGISDIYSVIVNDTNDTNEEDN